MKKKLLLLILLIGFVVFPINISAETKKYSSLNFQETLADDGIEATFKDYKPNDDAITIYMFRGKGCGYCHAFLEFMDSIADEYGQYFKMETYEVWYNQNNAELMTEVSTFLGNPAGGVPYIIIGEKVFGGYSETYSDQIKTAIMDLYKTKENKRYDVFKKMKKGIFNFNIKDNIASILPLIYTIVATGIIITYINLKFKELYADMNLQNNIKIKKKNRK